MGGERSEAREIRGGNNGGQPKQKMANEQILASYLEKREEKAGKDRSTPPKNKQSKPLGQRPQPQKYFNSNYKRASHYEKSISRQSPVEPSSETAGKTWNCRDSRQMSREGLPAGSRSGPVWWLSSRGLRIFIAAPPRRRAQSQSCCPTRRIWSRSLGILGWGWSGSARRVGSGGSAWMARSSGSLESRPRFFRGPIGRARSKLRVGGWSWEAKRVDALFRPCAQRWPGWRPTQKAWISEY